MTRQNKHRDIPMHIGKPLQAPPSTHLALGLFQHKEPTHPTLMVEKTHKTVGTTASQTQVRVGVPNRGHESEPDTGPRRCAQPWAR